MRRGVIGGVAARGARVAGVLVCVGAAVAQDWAQYGAGPERMSLAGVGAPPRVGAERWRVAAHAGEAVTFPNPGGVVAAGGVVYAVGKVGGVDAAIAVDGATGAVRWAAPVAAPVLGSWSSPAVDVGNGVVVIAAGTAVTALRVADGSVAWTAGLEASVVNASPCVTTDRGAADRVLITDYAPFGVGRLYCINIDPFDGVANPYAPGAILWSIPIGGTSGNTPAYRDGRVYVSCSELTPGGAGAVLCFELTDEAPAGPVWVCENPAGQGYFGGVCVADGPGGATVYAASYGFAGGQFAGDLAAIDAGTGVLRWHAACNRTDSTPVPLPGGRVLVSGGVDGFGAVPSLQLFEAGGALVWDSALATWEDLNGNQRIDPGEYLRLGGWTHQPAVVVGAGGTWVIAGEPGMGTAPAARLALVRIDETPGNGGFVAEWAEGVGATPAVAAAGGVGMAFSAGAGGLAGLGAAACYANCDGSTSAPVLNVNDFICFQSAFAAGDPYANCDGSTAAPVLNVNDFVCFQGAFAGGCP